MSAYAASACARVRRVELILITHERKVWRIPLPKLAIGIDPASPDIRVLDINNHHHSVGAIAYYPRSDLLAIVGGPHSFGDRAKDGTHTPSSSSSFLDESVAH
jgi:hypothetical protein